MGFGTFTAFAADGDTCTVADCGGTYTNGICTKVEGETHYQPATETTDKYNLDGNGENDTVYEIGNAGQL